MKSWEDDSLVKWMDNTFTVLDGLSLMFGWAIALIVHAQRKDAAQLLEAPVADWLPATDTAENPGQRSQSWRTSARRCDCEGKESQP